MDSKSLKKIPERLLTFIDQKRIAFFRLMIVYRTVNDPLEIDLRPL